MPDSLAFDVNVWRKSFTVHSEKCSLNLHVNVPGLIFHFSPASSILFLMVH